MTVRATGARIGVDKDTAWKWRHALLAAHLRAEAGRVSGIVEVVEQRHVASDKGARTLCRQARRRGYPYPNVQGKAIWVIIASDRNGLSAARATGPRPRRSIIDSFLAGSCSGARLIMGHSGRLSPLAQAARSRGVRYERVARWGSTRVSDSDRHTLNGERYARRFREWLCRFRGVASKYLNHYVHWYWAIEPIHHRAIHLVLEAERAPPAPAGLVKSYSHEC